MSPINDSDYGLHTLEIPCADLINDCSSVSAETHCTTCFGELLICEVVESSPENSPPLEDCHDPLVAGCTKPNCLSSCEETEGLGTSSKDDTTDATKKSTDTCNGKGEADDTDYSGNCCTCLAGETVEN